MLVFLEGRQKELKTLCEKYGVKRMHVFGSICTEQFNENSDIDLLISFKKLPFEKYTDNYFELHEKLFNRKMDLLDISNSIDSIVSRI